MTDSEREEHMERTSSRAALDLYVPRRFTNTPESGEIPLEEYQSRGLFRERSPDLAEVLHHPRLLILAEPGGGKSVVARAAVHEALKAGRIPILVELKEYRGDLSAVLRTAASESLLRDEAASRTYVLDGIDEIPVELLSNFEEDLDALLKADPGSTVLATGRQAFYVAHRNHFLSLTAIFQILGFADQDIRRYVELSGVVVDDFLRAADRLDMRDQLANPFALWVLVERFKETGQLSDLRSEMVSATIGRLIQSRPRINAHRQRRALCMLAVALEIYSRNELTEDEALKVIQRSMRVSKPEADELLHELYGSILRRTTNGIAFQMRSYGEYLAAEELERADLRRVRELAFFDHTTPNDSWMNTLSYLVELNAQVRELFVRKFPFWVLPSSPSAFSKGEKTTVASGILAEFRRQQQYLRIDPRVRIWQFVRFITPAVEEELRRDLESAEEVLAGNALVILGVLRRHDVLATAVSIAIDRNRGAAIRQCAIIAVADAGSPANVPQLVASLTADDPIRDNLVDAIGAITDAQRIGDVLDLVLDTDAMLSATFYHFRDLRCRTALISVLRYLAEKPQRLNNIRIGSYIGPILGLLSIYFDAEIASVCADIFRAISDDHVYTDRNGPLGTIAAQLREVDRHGEVARLFFERQLLSPIPDDRLYFSAQFVASITTVEAAEWLIRTSAITLIRNLSGFVQGEVRELLRPHSGGMIDAQDESARRYAVEHEKDERERTNSVRRVQERLPTRASLSDALKDFNELTEARWPELSETFKTWLSREINTLLGTLDLEHQVRWEKQTLWAPSVYRLLIRIIPRYELTVVPDKLMVFAAIGMDDQAAVKYYRRFGFSNTAVATLERLLNAPPSSRALEGLVRFVRDAEIDSGVVRTALRSIATETSSPRAARIDALQILTKKGEDDAFFLGLRNDPEPAIAYNTLLTLVDRQHRSTIERELSRLLEDDKALRAGEIEIPNNSSLGWISKIREAFAWDKLQSIRERALQLELERVTSIVSGALAQIDRSRTAELIRQQLDVTPNAWRHFMQATAVETEQTARIEQAQRTPFDAVLKKLRGATSAERLMVVCEGPTDVPVFRTLLAQIPDTPEVIFDQVGGWGGLVKKDPSIFLIGAKEAIVVMDGDNGRSFDVHPPVLNSQATALAAKLSTVGVELLVLERYGIENYFPREAVERVLRLDLSAYFPLPPDISIGKHFQGAYNGMRPIPYSKASNEAVAMHVTLDGDLAGTDLRKIIFKIAETARRLAEE